MTKSKVLPVHLKRTDENVDEIGELTKRFGGAVGLSGVLANLNREGRRTRVPGLAVEGGFTWNEDDRATTRWWPQGITTSADADADDLVEGRRVLVTSWYSKSKEGSRLTFVDLETLRYRHVLLVDPDRNWLRQTKLRPLGVHAGGIVWFGPYLHVAGTSRGLFSCRLDDILEVKPSDATFGYRYVLPVRFSYRAAADDGFEKLRYSFLSLDRQTDPPMLIAGEYGIGEMTRRMVRYPLDGASWHLSAEDDGVSRPAWLDDRGISNMQGAALVGDRYYVTRSRGANRPGWLYVGAPGTFRAFPRALPPGPEDITYWPQTKRLWSQTEHPGKRWVFSMRLEQFGGTGWTGRARWGLAGLRRRFSRRSRPST